MAIGRAGFDKWRVWKARALGATVVDASRVVTAAPQQYDYSHDRGGPERSYRGPEAVRIDQLAGGRRHLYRIDHTGQVLTSRCLRRPLRRWARFNYHWDAWLGRVTWLAVEPTRPVRHRLGLRAATFRRIRSLVALWTWKGR